MRHTSTRGALRGVIIAGIVLLSACGKVPLPHKHRKVSHNWKPAQVQTVAGVPSAAIDSAIGQRLAAPRPKEVPAARWEHVVTASVRSASAANAGRVRIPQGWGRLALVTDGVHRELSGDEIAAVLAYTQDPATAARELTDLALLAGGGDNASATVVEVPLVPALPAQRTDTSPAFPEVAAEAADTA